VQEYLKLLARDTMGSSYAPKILFDHPPCRLARNAQFLARKAQFLARNGQFLDFMFFLIKGAEFFSPFD
jgi:hypothetical protein